MIGRMFSPKRQRRASIGHAIDRRVGVWGRRAAAALALGGLAACSGSSSHENLTTAMIENERSISDYRVALRAFNRACVNGETPFAEAEATFVALGMEPVRPGLWRNPEIRMIGGLEIDSANGPACFLLIEEGSVAFSVRGVGTLIDRRYAAQFEPAEPVLGQPVRAAWRRNAPDLRANGRSYPFQLMVTEARVFENYGPVVGLVAGAGMPETLLRVAPPIQFATEEAAMETAETPDAMAGDAMAGDAMEGDAMEGAAGQSGTMENPTASAPVAPAPATQ